MNWRCHQCGIDNPRSGLHRCEYCGELPRVLVLRGSGTGKELRMTVSADVGLRLLGDLVGEDRRFISEVQFHIRQDKAMGAWMVQAAEGATNRTYCNGSLVGAEPQPLGLGARLTVSTRGYASVDVFFES